MIFLLFFKSKNKNQDKNKGDPSAVQSDLSADVNAESLFDIDKLIVSGGKYIVYSHDQGRKQLEKALRANIK